MISTRSPVLPHIFGFWVAVAIVCRPVAHSAEAVKITSLTLDGVAIASDLAHGVTVPNGTRDLRIQIAASGRDGNATRVRYRLEGFDSEWQDPPAQMRAVIHFQDSHGLEVGASANFFSGSSSGWRQSLDRSNFDTRTMEALAPSRCERAFVEFVSGGADATLGVYAIHGFNAEVIAADGRAQLFDFPMNAGIDLESPLGTPTGWVRQGSNPGMAIVSGVPGRASDYMLVLRDEDSRSYCSWRIAPAKAIAMRPGDRLRVQWKECFSIGAAGPATANYRYLRPGRYRFQMLAAAATGEPITQVSGLDLTVRPPLWLEPWTWLLGTAGVIGAVAFAVRRATQRRMQQKLAELERRRALEGERARIAQDIHDDLGASLAQIAMLSELVQADLSDAHAAPRLQEIYTRAHAAGRKLDEIVWALNSAHDSAEDLVGYFARFAQDYLSLAGIRFRLDVPPLLAGIHLSSAQRHQLFLALKEAVHNAARHSRAGEITLRVRADAGQLRLEVRDDGCGFAPPGESASSRGSANMRTRIERLGGQFERITGPGAGTTVAFHLPLGDLIP